VASSYACSTPSECPYPYVHHFKNPKHEHMELPFGEQMDMDG
jgi:hypothetical protein